jgi:hypothetical protein
MVLTSGCRSRDCLAAYGPRRRFTTASTRGRARASGGRWRSVKDFRQIAARHHDKLACNYTSAVALAAAIAFWLGKPTSYLGDVLYVEASHLAVSKTENVSDRLVLQRVRLAL